MAKKDDNSSSLYMFGLLLLLPCLIISILNYIRIRIKFGGRHTRRIADFRRLFKPITFGCSLLGGAVLLLFILIGQPESEMGKVPQQDLRFMFIPALALTAVAIIVIGMNISVMYLGVVVNYDKNFVAFSHDMQSYGIIDYIFLKFLIDYARVDNVPLSRIEKISRGHGKDLYLHGDFGSRRLRMSSKQKRDECITALQIALTNSTLITEMENY